MNFYIVKIWEMQGVDVTSENTLEVYASNYLEASKTAESIVGYEEGSFLFTKVVCSSVQ